VHEQRDDELWDVLIAHAISSPELTTALLQDIGSYCNPLRLLKQIPDGMEISGLRDSLVKIISDFRTQTSLREVTTTSATPPTHPDLRDTRWRTVRTRRAVTGSCSTTA